VTVACTERRRRCTETGNGERSKVSSASRRTYERLSATS